MHTHYSHEFIASQKSALEAQREELKAELSQISSFDEASGTYMATQPELESGSPEEMGETSTESEIGQTNSAVVSELATALTETELALQKIEDGTYGICEAGGDYIEEARLVAYPAARTCEAEAS